MIENAYITLITKNSIDGIIIERFASVRQPSLVQYGDDLPRDLAGCVLLKDITYSLCLILVDEDFFIFDFESVSDASADKVSFLAALVLPSAYLLRKFRRVRMNLWT